MEDRASRPERQVGRERYSQGALFNVKPTAEHRWPRGYTPERQAEVAEAMRRTPHEVILQKERPGSPYLATNTMNLKGVGWGQVMEQQAGRARRVHTDVLARSTVPVEHMQGLPDIHVHPMEPGVAGSYTHPGQHLGEEAPRGRIRLDPMLEGGKTLVHEIGHHIDYQTDPEAFVGRGYQRRPVHSGGTASPALEGAAEGYAQLHTVPRRGQEREPTSYEDFWRNPKFQERFYGVSGQLPRELESRKEAPAGWNPSAPFQQHLWMRAADISETNVQRDFGQWGTALEGGGELGTIRVGGGPPAPSERYRTGFLAGDEERVKNMRTFRRHDVPKEHRQRVARVWNALHPTEPLRED
jgi:hypothetical protein